MTETRIFAPSAKQAEQAHIDEAGYQTLYQASLENNDSFWAEHGKRITWKTPFSTVSDVSYDKADVRIKWFEDGTLNASENCLDRHLTTRGDQTAIIWEGDDPADALHITYKELHEQVCRFANALKERGITKGDRVTIYMPMILEASFAMLACARIGAVHSVVFGGFSPDALAGRITDCDSTFVITADQGLRGTKTIPLKENCDAACEIAGIVKTVLTVQHTGGSVNMSEGRDVWLHEALEGVEK